MKPVVITMGCPGGIGPEIILKYFSETDKQTPVPCVVAGDINVLAFYRRIIGSDLALIPWQPRSSIPVGEKAIPVLETSFLNPEVIKPGKFSPETSTAMAQAITTSIQETLKGNFSAICTCPISKEALQLSGHMYPGHTEMLGDLTGSSGHIMMMAGKSLKVTLATVHCALAEVPAKINCDLLIRLFKTTYNSLKVDFGIKSPRLAVAALNPHGGEGGMFGSEEKQILLPAMEKMKELNIPLHGPFPPDTVFYKAARGDYDAVVCMYHDQGLIPFKLLHFEDGVNVTLGLPIVRTSVDHGTAYDIAAQGVANPSSLRAAIQLAQTICLNRG